MRKSPPSAKSKRLIVYSFLVKAHVAPLAGSYMLVELRKGASRRKTRRLIASWLRDSHATEKDTHAWLARHRARREFANRITGSIRGVFEPHRMLFPYDLGEPCSCLMIRAPWR